jgi:hypothetical protein
MSPDASQNYTLTVNQAPQIASTNAAAFDVGVAGSFTVNATGFPAPTVSETGALPSGVTFTNNGNGTATIAGTPAAGTSGLYPLTIGAGNGTGSGATQKFSLHILAPPSLFTPAPSTTLASWTQVFEWALGSEGVTQTSLQVGTTGAGSSNIYNGTMGTATYAQVTNIPLNGATLYVRLNYMLSGNTYFVDYQYTEPTIAAPVLQTPTNNAPISGSTNFSWSPATPTPTDYQLRLGIDAPGSGDLFVSTVGGSVTAVSANIPSNGATVYVTLDYLIDGTWRSVNTTYMEAGTPTAPSLSSPTSSVLSGPTLFQWTGGTGIQSYELYIGTTGAESRDVYYSGALPGATTSSNVTIPSQGKKLYVRLRWEINNVWHYADYNTFSEAP